MWQNAEERGHRGESSQKYGPQLSTRHDDDDDGTFGTWRAREREPIKRGWRRGPKAGAGRRAPSH